MKNTLWFIGLYAAGVLALMSVAYPMRMILGL